MNSQTPHKTNESPAEQIKKTAESAENFSAMKRKRNTAVSTKVVPQKCQSEGNNVDWYYG